MCITGKMSHFYRRKPDVNSMTTCSLMCFTSLVIEEHKKHSITCWSMTWSWDKVFYFPIVLFSHCTNSTVILLFSLQLSLHWQRQKQQSFLTVLALHLPVLRAGWIIFCALGIRPSCYWLTVITAMWLWTQVALYIHVCPYWHFILWILNLEAWSWSFINITSSSSDPDSWSVE